MKCLGSRLHFVLPFTGLGIKGSRLVSLVPKSSVADERIAYSRVIGHVDAQDFEDSLREHVVDCNSCRDRYTNYVKDTASRTGELIAEVDRQYLNLLEVKD